MYKAGLIESFDIMDTCIFPVLSLIAIRRNVRPGQLEGDFRPQNGLLCGCSHLFTLLFISLVMIVPCATHAGPSPFPRQSASGTKPVRTHTHVVNSLIDHEQAEYHKDIQASFRTHRSTRLVLSRYDHYPPAFSFRYTPISQNRLAQRHGLLHNRCAQDALIE